MRRNGSDPAFPNVAGEQPCEGMMLREWLAGQALAGALASTKYNTSMSEDEVQRLARRAVLLADETLKELNK